MCHNNLSVNYINRRRSWQLRRAHQRRSDVPRPERGRLRDLVLPQGVQHRRLLRRRQPPGMHLREPVLRSGAGRAAAVVGGGADESTRAWRCSWIICSSLGSRTCNESWKDINFALINTVRFFFVSSMGKNWNWTLLVFSCSGADHGGLSISFSLEDVVKKTI